MIKEILLSLLILIVATSVVHAEQTFSERKANLAEFSAIRVGYGSGTVRIVVDISKKVEFTESSAENPSRIIIDLKDTWLNPSVQREIELKSTAAKKIRIAQFNPTTVRVVIESMAEIKPFHLTGGSKGYRFVIDVGNANFKANPELNKPNNSAQKENELQKQQEREKAELEAKKRERELKEQQEREAKEKYEQELREKWEREAREKYERELKEQQEREAKEKYEQELREKWEREAKEKREQEFKEQQEREAKEKYEQELREKWEREAKEQAEREKREAKEQEKARKEKLDRDIKEQREREKKLQEQEKKERREREKREKDKKNDKENIDDKDNPEVLEPFKDLDKDLSKITALSGKKIVIDPGHGGNDAGAIGPTGVMEKNVTLKVSLELKKLLEAEGAQVIMTRENDRTVSAKGAAASDIEELGARCEVANRIGADIFISIHADSFTRPEARGTTGYYYSKSTSGHGQKLADAIRRNLVEQLGTPSRGTQPCNFYVVKHTDMPATLIELGFISNKDEEKLLDSAEGVKKAAQGILDGIEDYFG